MVIILLNGAGRSGKDYLVSRSKVKYVNYSYVQPIKDISSLLFGYDESIKSDRDRSFLAKFSDITEEYCNYCFNKTKEKIDKYIKLHQSEKDFFMFIHIGKSEDIQAIKCYIKQYYRDFVYVYKILVESFNSVGEDDPRFHNKGIDRDIYDYIFFNKKNNKSVDEFSHMIKELVR